MSSEFVPVARVEDIPPGNARSVFVGEREIGIFNAGGTLYALDNTCPHQGAPLTDGWLDGDTITCPWHAWCFNLRDGQLALGAYAHVTTYDVRVEDGSVLVSREPRPGP